MSLDSKQCTKCGQEKPLEDFHRNVRSKDGFRTICKMCRAEYYQENREAFLSYQVEYRMDNREATLAYASEYREANKDKIAARSAEYYAENRDDILAQKAEYYQDNREKILAYTAQWRDDNRDRIKACNDEYRQTPKGKEARRQSAQKRRALKKGAECDIAPGAWEAKQDDYDWHCAYCGIKCIPWGPEREPNMMTQEHIIPLSRGGSHTIGNVVPACLRCNEKKHDRTPEELGWRVLSPEEV